MHKLTLNLLHILNIYIGAIVKKNNYFNRWLIIIREILSYKDLVKLFSNIIHLSSSKAKTIKYFYVCIHLVRKKTFFPHFQNK